MQPQRPIVGEVGLDLRDRAEFARLDRAADQLSAGEQPRAVADHDADAVRLFQPGRTQAVRHGVGDRLLHIDVLAGARGLLCERQVQVVREAPE